MRIWKNLLSALSALCLAAAVQAQGFPSKQISIVAPYPPGGATDLYARSLANGLAELGQATVVENRAGASGMIGAEHASRQPADGHTLLIGASSMFSVLPLLSDRMKNVYQNIQPVSLLGFNPSYVVVPADLPVNTVQELVAYLKANPGKFGYASAGKGTSQHVFMELFKQRAGVDVFPVQYKGSGPMVIDLIAGRTVMAIEQGPAVLTHIKSGKLKALAVTTAKRSQALPAVPTLAETVLPGFEAVTWFAVYAPAGTPKAALDKLVPQIAKTMASTEVKERLHAVGVEPTASTPDEVAKRQAAETAMWKDVIARSKISLED
ncbi:tripartite tricarboxylate transporter substrate binding protein [Ramlibacter henchirensis]|uniref:Tripartite tricarboxylate transporter substrate binding protein n=1 Tax=Ramlibacter henchirensis TaxID=204072 RepID=A0A4Z0BY04_9BURK|nr:tripartite tricarboxylate transporter substrate binding protein [Ramlibacter henchirensis]TFZ02799.1 tripartite tricarboxylate transporter substrate binding protein [Ramlibacter henchirensis]